MKDLISVFCGDISEFMTCHGTVSLSLNPPYHSIRPVAQGGGAWGRVVPLPNVKLNRKSCPNKPKVALADFNHFDRSYK